jgi:hypothetical protein
MTTAGAMTVFAMPAKTFAEYTAASVAVKEKLVECTAMNVTVK